ncbi:TPA: hypothetical protein ACUNCG_000434 [Aeromonas hydrophila]
MKNYTNKRESATITTIKNLLDNKLIKLNSVELWVKFHDADSEIPHYEEYGNLMENIATENPDSTVDEINEIIRDVNVKIANTPITIEVLAKKKYMFSSFSFWPSEEYVLLTISGKRSEFVELIDLIRHNKKYNF